MVLVSICGNIMPTGCNRGFYCRFQLHTRPATWKPQHELPQAATNV